MFWKDLSEEFYSLKEVALESPYGKFYPLASGYFEYSWDTF